MSVADQKGHKGVRVSFCGVQQLMHQLHVGLGRQAWGIINQIPWMKRVTQDCCCQKSLISAWTANHNLDIRLTQCKC